MDAGFDLNLEGFSVDEGVRHFATSRFDNAGEGGSRDLHLIGGGFLILALEIGKAKGFDFIKAENDKFQLAGGNAGRLEQ